LILAVAGGVLFAELSLHIAPSLLPRSYRAGFPANGCEFFHPDVFETTPIEGVLLPHLASAHDGPPPADLVEMGLARDNLFDRQAFPRVELPADALGFPNTRTHERVDLVFVGDSFGVALGARSPEGLVAALERTEGLAIANLSLAGIGPVQERWLIETRALTLAPKAIVLFYFSGNDLTASYEPFLARRDGKRTWQEAWPERRKPFWILPDLVSKALRTAPPPLVGTPLSGFRFPRADGSTLEVWFHPDYLRQLGWSRADWEAHPVWAPVQTELRGARDACTSHGVRFLLVYLPSKPEVLLPYVERNTELARRTIGALGIPPPAGSADELYAALLANRHAQEELIRDFCARENIPFFSATLALEAQAACGELGYLASDTHWQSLGQAALLEPLRAFLRGEGLLGEDSGANGEDR
jgi:hypothetical protein